MLAFYRTALALRRRELADTEPRLRWQDAPAGVTKLGMPSLYTCPECHGVLLRLKQGGGVRFRCHTGHSYTADALLAEMTEVVEGTHALFNHDNGTGRSERVVAGLGNRAGHGPRGCLLRRCSR